MVAEIARGYFQTRFEAGGWALFDTLISSSNAQPAALVLLLRTSRDPEAAWQRADALGDDVLGEYWNQFTKWDLCLDGSLAVEAARRLGSAGRADTTIDLLASFADEARSDLEFAHAAAEALLDRLQHEGDTDVSLTCDAVASLLVVLNRHAADLGEQKVAGIEWAYLPALGRGAETPCLHKAMAEDPEFFAEMVEIAHSSTSDTPRAAGAESENHVAERSADAYGLLHEWPRSPGLDADGNVDASLLRDWTQRARAQLADVGLPKHGDIHIGPALAAAPPHPAGQWPAAAVCELIEQIASQELECGFSTAVFNSRGVISRSLWEGGQRERELAERYRRISDELSTTSPRSAACSPGWPTTTKVTRHL